MRIQAWVCLRRLALASAIQFGFGCFSLCVQERIANAGMCDSLGIVQLSGRPGEKRNYYKVSRRELEARRQWDSLFSFCQPGSHDVGRGLTWSTTMADRWI